MKQAYYTLKQASEMLQLSTCTIQRKIKAGSIPKAEWCGKILIPARFFKEAGYEDKTIEHVFTEGGLEDDRIKKEV